MVTDRVPQAVQAETEHFNNSEASISIKSSHRSIIYE